MSQGETADLAGAPKGALDKAADLAEVKPADGKAFDHDKKDGPGGSLKGEDSTAHKGAVKKAETVEAKKAEPHKAEPHKAEPHKAAPHPAHAKK